MKKGTYYLIISVGVFVICSSSIQAATLEKISSPSQIKYFKNVVKRNKSLYGIRISASAKRTVPVVAKKTLIPIPVTKNEKVKVKVVDPNKLDVKIIDKSPELKSTSTKDKLSENISRSFINTLICGPNGVAPHELDVKESFARGFRSYKNDLVSGAVTVSTSTNFFDCMEYAVKNSYSIVVRSTSGLYESMGVINKYPQIMLFMPAGSNDHNEVFYESVTSSPIVITGAGREHNKTGYAIEFFSKDPFSDTVFRSSFSNGYIAGQLAYIASKLTISLSQARLLARETASNSGTYNREDGFGVIQTDKALAKMK